MLGAAIERSFVSRAWFDTHVRKRALADFNLAVKRIDAWLLERGVRGAQGHLLVHGRQSDAADMAIHRCTRLGCVTTFAGGSERPNSCPRCGTAGEAFTSSAPSPDECCEYVRSWGQCSYRRDCAVCGVAVVREDLELALADREARGYEVDLLHELARTTRRVERDTAAVARSPVAVEANRDRVMREAAPRLTQVVNGYIAGRATHLDHTLEKIRIGEQRVRKAGFEPATIEPRPTERTFEDVVNTLVASGGRLGLANPTASPRQLGCDPDRELLGVLQAHLRAHGLSYVEIAGLLPDGADGTPAECARRVETRLRKRAARRS